MADRLTITSATCAPRAALGPLAWAALETVVLDADIDGVGVFGAATTVRKLASQLAVNKDTAGRALSRLIDHGYLCRTERGESRYELTVIALELFGIDAGRVTSCPGASDITVEATPRPSEPDTTTSTVPRPRVADGDGDRRRAGPRRSRRPRVINAEQLTLIDLSPDD